MDDYEYFGHHQMLRATPDSIRLGVQPNAPINTYRSGEKVVFSGAVSGDFEVGVTMQFHDGASSRDAGLLFRTTGPSIGYDALRGYFAGLVPRTNLLILGKMDGMKWQELYRREVDIDVTQPVRLKVSAWRSHLRWIEWSGRISLTIQPIKAVQSGSGLSMQMRPLAICQYTNQVNSESV